MPQSSPTPQKTKKSCKAKKKTKYHDFCWALDTCVKGGNVTRKSWDDESAYLFIKSDLLYIMRDGEEHTLTVSVLDIMANDWYSVTT